MADVTWLRVAWQMVNRLQLVERCEGTMRLKLRRSGKQIGANYPGQGTIGNLGINYGITEFCLNLNKPCLQCATALQPIRKWLLLFFKEKKGLNGFFKKGFFFFIIHVIFA